MFGPLGVPELIFIFVLALLIFGPKRLPEMGRTIGKALGEFRRATSDLKSSFDAEMSLEDEPQPTYRRPPAPKRPEPDRPDRPAQEAPRPAEATEQPAKPTESPEPEAPETSVDPASSDPETSSG